MSELLLNGTKLAEKTGSTVTLSNSVVLDSNVNINSSLANATFPAGMVLEQFCSPCDGSAITVQSGTYTVQNVTGGMTGQTGWVDITGSSITYTPPTGTQTVIYQFDYHMDYEDSNAQMNTKLFLDSDEIVYARSDYHGWNGSYPGHGRVSFKWAFNIGGSASTNTGRVESWTSAKTIKLQMRNYNSSYQMQLHQMQYYEGTDSTAFVMPVIGITAIAG